MSYVHFVHEKQGQLKFRDQRFDLFSWLDFNERLKWDSFLCAKVNPDICCYNVKSEKVD